MDVHENIHTDITDFFTTSKNGKAYMFINKKLVDKLWHIVEY